MLGYSDSELAALGGYDLVHYDDLSYISSAHQEREFTNHQSLFISHNHLFCSQFWKLARQVWLPTGFKRKTESGSGFKQAQD